MPGNATIVTTGTESNTRTESITGTESIDPLITMPKAGITGNEGIVVLVHFLAQKPYFRYTSRKNTGKSLAGRDAGTWYIMSPIKPRW